VIAAHKVPDFERDDFEEAGRLLLGKHDERWFDLIAVLGIWILSGAYLGYHLAQPPSGAGRLWRQMGRGARRGFFAGARFAPWAVLLFLVIGRATLSASNLAFEPTRTRRETAGLEIGIGVDSDLWIGAVVIAVIIVLLCAFQYSTRPNWLRFSRRFLTTIFVLTLLVYLSIPLLGNVRSLGLLLLLASAVWIIPGTVVGAVSPLLNRAEFRSREWAPVMAIGALILILVAQARSSEWGWWLLGGALLMISVFMSFDCAFTRQGWPLAILGVGLTVAGVTDLLRTQFPEVIAMVRELRVVPKATKGQAAPFEPSAPPNLHFDLDKALKYFPTSAEQKERIRAFWNRADPDGPGQNLLAWHDRVYERACQIAGGPALGDPHSEPAANAQDHHESKSRQLVIRIRVLKQLHEEINNSRRECQKQFSAFITIMMIKPGSADHVAQVVSSHQRACRTLDEVANTLAAHIEELEKKVGPIEAEESRSSARFFELSLAGSYGFWLTMGLLAGFAISRRNSIHSTPRREQQSDPEVLIPPGE
jgi:hypothetical protein